MNRYGYIYQAGIYCGECGDRICSSLRTSHPALCPEDDMDQSSYDSDDFPKAADVHNEESDCPEHCAECGEFLRNPLTSHGYAYVKEQLDTIPAGLSISKLRDAGHPALAEWASWYDFSYWDADDCADEDGRTTGWYSREAF